jgi:hypothetical protein
LEKIQQIKQELEDAMKAAQEKCAALFKESCKEIFEKNPELESFGWVQYTPYFNDGDECLFRVSCDVDCGLRINGEMASYILEEFDYKSDEYKAKSQELEKYEEICELVNAIDGIPGDLLKQIFGDHVTVDIKRDGTHEVEEYCHD